MKKIAYLLVVILLPFIAVAQDTFNLSGKWGGTTEGEYVEFEFRQDGYAFFTIDGETIGGASFEIDGLELAMTYDIKPLQQDSYELFINFITKDNPEDNMLLEFTLYVIDMNTVQVKGAFLDELYDPADSTAWFVMHRVWD